MERLKTFAIYALIVIGFFILSDILIFVGLNSSYDNITAKGEIDEQISVTRAEATLVNGRIYGSLNNLDNNLDNKYLKVNVYSKRDVLLAERYYKISDVANDNRFKVYFKAQDVEYYTINIVDGAKHVDDKLFSGEFLDNDMTKFAIFCALILAIK